MEELLDRINCADYDQLFQAILCALDDELNDLEYMVNNEGYSNKEICSKIIEIRGMIK